MNENFSNLAPINFVPMIQDFLSARLVAKEICDTRTYDEELAFGQEVDWPYVTDPYSQDYTPGTDLVIDGEKAYSDKMTIDQSQASTFPVTPKEMAQAKDKGYVTKLADRQSYVLANSVDYKLLKEGVDNAQNSITVGAATVSNFLSHLTNATAKIENEDAADGALFYVMDPDRRALLTQIFVANGFKEGDLSLRNGFMGNVNGADFYMSNNLPATVNLTIAVNPTAGDTITIKGVTFVYQAVADAAGEIVIGGNAAATQVNTRAAINGTGTGDGTDYFELEKRDRRKLQNKHVVCGVFAVNVATITSAGKMAPSSAFTSGSNFFGTETISLLHGVKGAIGLGMQIKPTHYVGKEPKRPEENRITYQMYGKKVPYRGKFRLCKLVVNA